ncbi:hypothetical protein [Fimbriiglobus ruber]|uniref:hypothetical protein n=1 Tax=Fimbriiglobus ruber TaxID=1908690 RepID=UPI00137ACBA6|nr:hypothetical protein [Fimbriiglobus ruber]
MDQVHESLGQQLFGRIAEGARPGRVDPLELPVEANDAEQGEGLAEESRRNNSASISAFSVESRTPGLGDRDVRKFCWIREKRDCPWMSLNRGVLG